MFRVEEICLGSGNLCAKVPTCVPGTDCLGTDPRPPTRVCSTCRLALTWTWLGARPSFWNHRPPPRCLLKPGGLLACSDSLHLACRQTSACCGASDLTRPRPPSAKLGAASCPLPLRMATALAPSMLGGVGLLLPAWMVSGGRTSSWTLADVGQSHAPAADRSPGSLVCLSRVGAVLLGWPETAFPGGGNQARPLTFSLLLLPTLSCQR